MKKKNRIILFIFCIMYLLVMSATAASGKCVCRDQNGEPYPENTDGSVFCYKKTDDGWILNEKLTYSQCEARNLAEESSQTENIPVDIPVPEQPAAPIPEVSQPEPVQEKQPEPVQEQQPEPVQEQQPEPVYEPQPEPVIEQQPEPVYEPQPEPVIEQQPEPVYEPQPEPVIEQQPEPVYEPQPEPVIEQQPEPVYEPQPEPVYEPQPEPVYEPQPEPVIEQQPEPVYEPQPEPVYEQQPEPVYEPQPEPVYEPQPEPVYEPQPEPVYEPQPEPVYEPQPEPVYEPQPEPVIEQQPEPVYEPITEIIPEVNEPQPDDAPIEPVMLIFPPSEPEEPDENQEENMPVEEQPVDEENPDQHNNGDEKPENPPDEKDEEEKNTPENPDTVDPEKELIDDPQKVPEEKPDNKKEKKDPTEKDITEKKEQEESELSKKALKELSAILTKKQLADINSFLTEKWLLENRSKLSKSTVAELTEILEKKGISLPVIRDEDETSLLAAPSVSIEGILQGIQLSTPNGETIKTGKVPFVWTYHYDEKSSATEVTFKLTLTIKTAKDTVKLSSTVSSAACANSICRYTADLSSYKSAKVTWTVSGTYDDGGVKKTVKADGSRSFTLKIDGKPTPTPTPTPKPKQKPEAPVQECPVGRYITRNLGFYWAPSKYAESYTVEWWNDKGQKGSMNLSNKDVTCQNKRCIVNTTLPGVGNYVWTVTAKNKAGSARSKEMRFEIASNISTPRAYRPNGTIVNRTYPSFEWEDVRDGAIEYRIQVVGKYDNRIRMDRWFKVSDIYVGNGICYVKTDLFLPAGTYSWRVQARNNDFASGWSAWCDFYVECDYCNYNNIYYNNYANTVPSCSYPVGTITVNKPEFQWRTLTGASYYIVKLFDPSGTVQFEKQVSSSNCTVELCKWNPNYTLTKNGNYSWTVSGHGANGSLWGSASGSFIYNGAVTLKPLSFLRPAQNGYLSDETPVIIWTDQGNAVALFHVEIFDKAKTLLFSADLNREQAWCDGITCSIEFKTIPDAENYTIAITPYSELNQKGDTASLTFSKGGKTLTLSSPKDGAVVSSRPLFRWQLDLSENTQYELILTDANNNVSTISPLVCGAVGVTCEGGEAFYSPASALPAGEYRVKLAASGINAVSEEIRFTVK